MTVGRPDGGRCFFARDTGTIYVRKDHQSIKRMMKNKD